jgi:fatty acid desaturase
VIEFLASFAEQQRRFLLFMIALAVAGIVYVNGWSWTSAIVVALAVLVVAGFWSLTTFWLSFFRDIGRKESR